MRCRAAPWGCPSAPSPPPAMARVEDDVHMLVLHLVILPFLTVEEDPIGTFLPVLFLVTWPTFNIIDDWRSIILETRANGVLPGGNLTPL